MNLAIRSIDCMKYTKDLCTNQFSDAQIQSAIASYKSAHANVVAISIPLSSNAEFVAHGSIPSPRTVENFTKVWCDTIHNAGMNVLFRGVFCENEAIYNFPFQQQTSDQLIAKIKNYITSHPDFFADGDYFAPFPEGTNVIPGHNFGDIFVALPNGASSYADFFIALHKAENEAFTQIGKRVNIGYSTNNWSELNSGWIPNSLFDDAGIVCMDDYETPNVADQHIRDIVAKKGHPMFHQEIAIDYSVSDPVAEMQLFCDGIKQRVSDGVQVGVNWWGGWTGANESIIEDDGQGGFTLNPQGKVLANLYASYDTQPTPTPVPTPVPVPSQYDHVVLVMMENTKYGDVIGNTTDCPYINSLLSKGASLANMRAISHPSLPNYLALISGDTQGHDGDDNNVDRVHLITNANIIDSLEAKGLSSAGYMEDMPIDWYTKLQSGDTGNYVEHHNPFVYFAGILTTPLLNKVLPLSALDTANLPAFSYIVPQVNHDMHDANGATNRIKAGDAFLAGFLPQLLSLKKTLVILTWDEDDDTDNNHIATLLLGDGVKQGFVSDVAYTHYSTLATIEKLLGLPTITGNDKNAPTIDDVFGTTTPVPTPQPVPNPAPTDPVLGGLDLDMYCTNNHDGTSHPVGTTWQCTGDNAVIDLTVACRKQYNNPHAYAHQDKQNDPYSWTCYVGTAIPVPTPVPTPTPTKYEVFSGTSLVGTLTLNK